MRRIAQQLKTSESLQKSPLLTPTQKIARKSTWVSFVINLVMTVVQIIVGAISHSQALVADGFHSLSDLLSDVIVLIAAQGMLKGPDSDHHYGHNRYEDVATLLLGLIFVIVGFGMLWRGVERASDIDAIPAVHLLAFWVALLTLLIKEGLFRYLLRQGERARSRMLIANAWHSRSDAASSLVVAVGILGNWLGVRVLDPIAAILVGFMIVRLGWKFGWDALQDLSDRALSATMIEQIRQRLTGTEGVLAVHDLRTRKAGDLAVVDAHVQVDPRISVSEGHAIGERARHRVLEDSQVLDVLIHIDSEKDIDDTRYLLQPSREEISNVLTALLTEYGLTVQNIAIHYLEGMLELDIYVIAAEGPTLTDDFRHTLSEKLKQHFAFKKIRWFIAID